MAEKTLELSSQGVYKGFFPYLKKNHLRKKKNKKQKHENFTLSATSHCRVQMLPNCTESHRPGREKAGRGRDDNTTDVESYDADQVLSFSSKTLYLAKRPTMVFDKGHFYPPFAFWRPYTQSSSRAR